MGFEEFLHVLSQLEQLEQLTGAKRPFNLTATRGDLSQCRCPPGRTLKVGDTSEHGPSATETRRRLWPPRSEPESVTSLTVPQNPKVMALDSRFGSYINRLDGSKRGAELNTRTSVDVNDSCIVSS